MVSFIRHTQSVDKFGLNADFACPFCDFFSATVHDDRAKSDQFQKCYVTDDVFFSSCSTMALPPYFYNDGLAAEFPYIR